MKRDLRCAGGYKTSGQVGLGFQSHTITNKNEVTFDFRIGLEPIGLTVLDHSKNDFIAILDADHLKIEDGSRRYRPHGLRNCGTDVAHRLQLTLLDPQSGGTNS
jgi:hypothetical protein